MSEEIKWPEVEDACKRVGNEIELNESKGGTSSSKFEGFIEDLKLILFGYWVTIKELEKKDKLCREMLELLKEIHEESDLLPMGHHLEGGESIRDCADRLIKRAEEILK